MSVTVSHFGTLFSPTGFNFVHLRRGSQVYFKVKFSFSVFEQWSQIMTHENLKSLFLRYLSTLFILNTRGGREEKVRHPPPCQS